MTMRAELLRLGLRTFKRNGAAPVDIAKMRGSIDRFKHITPRPDALALQSSSLKLRP